jgi:hypothetical protein
LLEPQRIAPHDERLRFDSNAVPFADALCEVCDVELLRP